MYLLNGSVLPTDEMRAKALARTRDVMAELEGIRRELGLEPTAINVLADTYGNCLQVELHKEQQSREKRNRKKHKEWLAKQPSFDSSPVGRWHNHLGTGGGLPDFNDDDDDEPIDDDDEPKAEPPAESRRIVEQWREIGERAVRAARTELEEVAQEQPLEVET